jgi:hypothetical protein
MSDWQLKNGEFCPDIKAEVWVRMVRINDANRILFRNRLAGYGTIFGASTSGLKVNIFLNGRSRAVCDGNELPLLMAGS